MIDVTPMVALHHFTTPRWFTAGGGFRRPDAPERFARYAEYVCEILHDVEWEVTINEPNMAALFATVMEAAASVSDEDADSDDADAAPLTTQMAAAGDPNRELGDCLGRMHDAGRRVVRARTNAKVGWAIAAQAFTPTPANEAVWHETFDAWEGVFYDWCDGDDFIGMQSYTSQPVDENGPVPHPESPENTSSGWVYRPDALEVNLRRGWNLKDIPLLVTENGIATDDDEHRIAYVTSALEGVRRTMDDGVEVLGYCYWSLLDNYEWVSYVPTFGLIAVDRAGDFARTPKPSLAWLGEVARTNGVSLAS